MKRLIIFFWSVALIAMLYLPQYFSWNQDRSKVLQIFCWADLFDPESIAEFEQLYGVKVKLHSFNSNEELLVKLKAKNSPSYDLYTPSDYAIPFLIRDNHLVELDPTKTSALFDQIHPNLKGKFFDPTNRYAIPFTWEVYGIGQDKTKFNGHLPAAGFSAIFDLDNIDYKLAISPDPIEAVCFASFYLYGNVDTLTKEQMAEVRKLLCNQKKFIEAYVDYRVRYLMTTKNCPLAVLRSSFIWHMLKDTPDMEFVLPQDVHYTSIETLAVSKDAQNPDLAYKFIEFMFEKQNHAKNAIFSFMYPTSKEALALIPDQGSDYYKTFEDVTSQDKMTFFKHLVSEEDIRDIWVSVKTSP